MKIADQFVSKRWFAFLLGCIFLLILACGLKQVTLENNYRTYIGDDNVYLKNSDWLSDRQARGLESAILLYVPADGDAFSQKSLIQYAHLATIAKTLPHVTETQSWLESEKMIATEVKNNDLLEYKAAPIAFGGNLFTEEGRIILREQAIHYPTILRRFVSADSSVAAIIVSLDLTDDGEFGRTEKINEFSTAVDHLEDDLKDIAAGDYLYATGSFLFEKSAKDILSDDIRGIFPFVFLITANFIYLVYRSFGFVLIVMFMVIVPVIATAGIVGWFNLGLSNLSASGLLLVATLAVADVLHISNTFFRQISAGVAKHVGMAFALRKNVILVAATTFTTSLGQIALLASDAYPIQVMGIVVIVGSFLALAFAILMLPALLMCLSPKNHHTSTRLAIFLSEAAGLAWMHSYKVCLVASISIGLLVTGILQGKLNDSLENWFGSDTNFHRSMTLLDAGFLGSDTFSLAVEAKSRDLVAAKQADENSDAANLYIGLKDALEQSNPQGYWLTPMSAIAAFREAFMSNRNTVVYKADDPAVQTLKAFSAESVAQSGLLTRWEPGKSDYSVWNFDPDATSSFERVNEAIRAQTTAIQEAGGRDVRIGGVGIAIADLSVRNYWSVLTSSSAAIALISITMFAVFRSWKHGAVAIAPNIAPIAIAFGFWGFWAGEFNLASITVVSVALGIVVDDTIHIILKYKQQLETNSDHQSAFADAIRECGVGIFGTTIILVIGFFALATSGFLLTAQKALLVGIAICAAFLFDLLVLPAIYGLLERFKSRRTRYHLSALASGDVK